MLQRTNCPTYDPLPSSNFRIVPTHLTRGPVALANQEARNLLCHPTSPDPRPFLIHSCNDAANEERLWTLDKDNTREVYPNGLLRAANILRHEALAPALEHVVRNSNRVVHDAIAKILKKLDEHPKLEGVRQRSVLL
ncbi:hypothetical protein DOTSEDRAFT_75236 [Dothistroma septosporum NZE10]|uniref:Uncharacterized protein n=1 Tax=Dothistroma septosporum (strain NZE10 / CBS 128990) TaxID=675120 RepID=M2YKV7_DOTSN|nr:hypothetical protein DOTSEDRAFT_75236 [Dothistroma septosporum NZE10]